MNIVLNKKGSRCKCFLCGHFINEDEVRIRLMVETTKRRTHLRCAMQFSTFIVRLPKVICVADTTPFFDLEFVDEEKAEKPKPVQKRDFYK